MRFISSIVCVIFFAVIIDINYAQKTFLDDFAFRPLFRRMRNFFFDLNNNQSEEEVFRINSKMNVRFYYYFEMIFRKHKFVFFLFARNYKSSLIKMSRFSVMLMELVPEAKQFPTLFTS